MISWLRSMIAFVLAGVLTALTFGRVELNRTGSSTASGHSDDHRVPAAAQSLTDAGDQEVPPRAADP